jgi:hypothetical protein
VRLPGRGIRAEDGTAHGGGVTGHPDAREVRRVAEGARQIAEDRLCVLERSAVRTPIDAMNHRAIFVEHDRLDRRRSGIDSERKSSGARCRPRRRGRLAACILPQTGTEAALRSTAHQRQSPRRVLHFQGALCAEELGVRRHDHVVRVLGCDAALSPSRCEVTAPEIRERGRKSVRSTEQNDLRRKRLAAREHGEVASHDRIEERSHDEIA